MDASSLALDLLQTFKYQIELAYLFKFNEVVSSFHSLFIVADIGLICRSNLHWSRTRGKYLRRVCTCDRAVEIRRTPHITVRLVCLMCFICLLFIIYFNRLL